jgi:hypothetical protein
LIYRGALPSWQSGIPLGNGDTNVVAYQNGAELCYGIMRAGFADTRNPIQLEKTHAEVRALWEAGRYDELEAWDKRENGHYMQHPFPNPRPMGVITLTPSVASADADTSRHVLSLQQATLTQRLPGLDTAVFVESAHDSVCLLVTSHAPIRFAYSPCVDYAEKGAHWWDVFGDIDAELQVRYTARSQGFLADVTLPGGESFCVACAIDGADLTADGDSAWTLTPQGAQPMRITLTVATHLDGPEYRQQAEARLDTVRALAYPALRDAHRAHWHRFWSVNCLVLEDKFLEQLFYQVQYLLGCDFGGKDTYSCMNSWHLGTHPWHGDMHTNINVEMAILPVFALHRATLSDAFDGRFVRHLADARTETARFWGMPGVTFPFASVGNMKPLHGGFWRYEVYVSCWVAQIFWERYRFSGDMDYLRETCYPIQREVLDFYEHFLEVDANGHYYFPMVKPVETQRGPNGSPFVRDMLLDVAALRQLLTAAITASTTLGIDDERRARWQEILEQLVPLPVDAQGVQFVAYAGASPDLTNDHPTLLGPVFPSGLALSEEEFHCAERAFEQILGASKRGMDGFPFRQIFAWGDDLSYSWITIAAARLGKREKAFAYLYDFLVLLQLKKNGLFTSRPSDVVSRDGKVSLINTTGGFALAITETLLQSFDGVIRVFPATPVGSTTAFAGLQAAGNFTVDAVQEAGALRYIRLYSGSGGIATIRNDWGLLVIRDAQGCESVTEAALLALPTEAGQAYLLYPVGHVPDAVVVAFTDEVLREPRTWTGPQYLEQLPADQAWTISLGQ